MSPAPIIAFCHIEKCAGSTLIHLLRQVYGLAHCDLIPCDPSSMVLSASDIRRACRLHAGRLASVAAHSLKPFRLPAGEEPFSRFRYYTILRDPIQRYISDYRFHVGVLGYRGSFDDWLRRTDRHDFMTRWLAPSEHVDDAISTVMSFSLVGLVEQYDAFLQGLERLSGRPFAQVPYRRLNESAGRGVDVDVRRYAPELESANRKDVALYRAVSAEIARRSTEGYLLKPEHAAPRQIELPAQWRRRVNHGVSRLYRNVVYKPMVGYAPGPHALPVYRNVNEQ